MLCRGLKGSQRLCINNISVLQWGGLPKPTILVASTIIQCFRIIPDATNNISLGGNLGALKSINEAYKVCKALLIYEFAIDKRRAPWAHTCRGILN